jgi:hypothetical protein
MILQLRNKLILILLKQILKNSRGQLLTDAEHSELINASPEERQTIVDRYYDEAFDAINQQEINASFPTENEKCSTSNEITISGTVKSFVIRRWIMGWEKSTSNC